MLSLRPGWLAVLSSREACFEDKGRFFPADSSHQGLFEETVGHFGTLSSK